MRRMDPSLNLRRRRGLLALLPGASWRASARRHAWALDQFQGLRNRRAAPRPRDPPPTIQASADDVGRPDLSCRGQPTPAAYPLAVLHRDARHAVGVASAVGGQAVDVRGTSGPATNPPGTTRA